MSDPWRSFGIPRDSKKRSRPSGVYTGDSLFGVRTRSGAFITLRGMANLDPVNGIGESRGRSCISVERLSVIWVCMRLLSISIHVDAGKGGVSKKDGIGIYPGSRTRRSAHL